MVVVKGVSGVVSAVAVDREMVGREMVDGVRRLLFCSWAARRAAEAERPDGEVLVDFGEDEKNWASFAAVREVDDERFRELLMVMAEETELVRADGDISLWTQGQDRFPMAPEGES